MNEIERLASWAYLDCFFTLCYQQEELFDSFQEKIYDPSNDEMTRILGSSFKFQPIWKILIQLP